MNLVCPDCGNPGGYLFCIVCGYQMFSAPCPFARMCQTCTCETILVEEEEPTPVDRFIL